MSKMRESPLPFTANGLNDGGCIILRRNAN